MVFSQNKQHMHFLCNLQLSDEEVNSYLTRFKHHERHLHAFHQVRSHTLCFRLFYIHVKRVESKLCIDVICEMTYPF